MERFGTLQTNVGIIKAKKVNASGNKLLNSFMKESEKVWRIKKIAETMDQKTAQQSLTLKQQLERAEEI